MPNILTVTSNIPSNGGITSSSTLASSRSFVGQPFKLTFTGPGLNNGDKVAWVAETNCDKAGQATAAIKAATISGVTGTGSSRTGVATWTASTAPTTATAGALRLCYWNSFTTNSDPTQALGSPVYPSQTWSYYGNMFYYSVVSVTSLSSTKFWDLATSSAYPGNPLTITGINIAAGDLFSYAAASSTGQNTCSGLSSFASANRQAVGAVASGVASFTTQLSFTSTYGSTVLPNFICWQPANTVAPFDTGARVFINGINADNVIYFAFPTVLSGASTTWTTPQIRYSGWNIQTGDVIVLASSASCPTTLPSGAANGVLGAPTAETTATGFNTFTSSIPSNLVTAVSATTFGTVATVNICYYPAGVSTTATLTVGTHIFPASWTLQVVSDANCLSGTGWSPVPIPNDANWVAPTTTTSTATFTQPASGSTVAVTVTSGTIFSVGNTVYITGGGYYSVTATASTTLTVSNLGYPGNTAAATIIATGTVSTISMVWAKGYKQTAFIRGCFLNNDVIGYDTTCSGAAPATTNAVATLTDGSWPYVQFTHPGGATPLKLCAKIRSAAGYIQSAIPEPVMDAALAGNGAGAVFAAPTYGANSVKWFMANWQYTIAGNRLLIAGASATAGNGQASPYLVIAAKKGVTDDQCAMNQYRGVSSAPLSNSKLVSRMRLNGAGYGEIDNTDNTALIGGSGTYIFDVSAQTDLTLCVRLTDGAPSSTNIIGVGSWVATSLILSQMPSITAFPRKTLGLSATGTTQPITILGAVTGDKINFIETGQSVIAASTGTVDTTFACQGSNVPTISLTPTSGVAVTSTGFSYSSTTNQKAFTTANAAHDICIIRAPDTRAVLLKETSSGANTITAASSGGSFTTSPFAAYAGSSIVLTPSTAGSEIVFSSGDAATVKFTTTDCTGTAMISPVTFTIASSWNGVTDSGRPVVSASYNPVTITVPFTASGLASGVICRNTVTTTTPTITTIRSVSLTGTCTSANGRSFTYSSGASGTSSSSGGCAGCTNPGAATTSRPIKVPGFGHYYPKGGLPASTTLDILFDGYAVTSSDKIGFSKTTPTGTGVAVTAGSGGVLFTSAVVSAHTALLVFDGTSTGVVFDSAVGGLYNIYYQVGGGSWLNTAQQFNIVVFKDRFPGSVLSTEATSTFYVDHLGLDYDSGDLYLTVGIACQSSGTAAPAASTTLSGPVTLATVSGTSYVSWKVTAPSAAATFDTYCYRAANSPSATWVKINTAASTIGYVSTASSTAPIVLASIADSSSNVYLMDGNTGTITLATSAVAATTTLNDGYQPVLVNSADGNCNNAVSTGTLLTGTTIGALKKNTAAGTVYSTSDFTVLTPTVSATTSNSYKVCFTSKKTTPAASDYLLLGFTILIRSAPSINTATGYSIFVRNALSTGTQNVDLTYATNAVKLTASDAICFTRAGNPAIPATAASATTFSSTYSVTVGTTTTTYTAWCVVAGANSGAQVDIKSLAGTSALPLDSGSWSTAYDVYASAGGGVLSGANLRSTPVKVTGQVVAIQPTYRPINVVASASSTTDFRTIYMDPESTGGNIVFGTCTTGTTVGTAVAAAGTKLIFTSGNTAACFQSARDKTASKIWVPLAQSMTIVSTLTTTNLANPLGATKVHAGVQQFLNLPWNSHVGQPGDIFRVLTYQAFSRSTTPASCTQSNVAADVLLDVTFSGQFSSTAGDSFSITGATGATGYPAQTSYYGSNGQQTVRGCWVQTTSTPNVYTDFPTTSLDIRIVDVQSFVIGSASAFNMSNASPRTMFSYFADTAFFNGRWIDQDDWASFVPSTATDCSVAWYQEQAIIGSAAAAAGDNFLSKSFSAYFEGGLPAGVFNLCFYSKGTTTGYKLYNGATDAKLRVIDATVSPSFATSGASTVFTLATTSNYGLVAPLLTSADRVAFTVDSGSGGSCAAASLVPASGATNGLANLTASGTFTASLAAQGGAMTVYEVCLDAQLANSWNTYNTSGGYLNNLFAGANLAASKSQGSVGYTATTALSRYHVVVYPSAVFATVNPLAVVAGMPTDLYFGGSGLSTSDGLNLNSTSDCFNTSTFTTPFKASPSSAPVAVFGASLYIPGFVGQPGRWNICYKPANGGAQGYSSHKQTIAVVNVTSISPTGVNAVPAAYPNGQTFTLSGFFNRDPDAIVQGDVTYAGLMPRDPNVGNGGDCTNFNAANADYVTVSSDNTATVNWANDQLINPNTEYMICIHHAGMLWTNNPAKDYTLVNQNIVNVSVRGISAFFPTNIANGTNQTVMFMGGGIRDGDLVNVITTVTGTPGTDCSATGASTVAGGKAILNVPAAGTYRICYGFNTSPISWSYATNTSLIANNFGLASIALNPSATPADTGSNLRVTLTGFGIAAGDSARIVAVSNITASGSAACDPAVGTGSAWTRTNIDASNNIFFDVVPGDALNGTTYGICYKFAGIPATLNPTVGYNATAFQIAFTTGARILGFGPQMAPAGTASVNFVFVGLALTASDSVTVVAGATATCSSLTGAVQVTLAAVSGLTGGRATANATYTLPASSTGAYTVCYYFKGAVAGASVQRFQVMTPIATCIAANRYFCNGVCQAAPCTLPATATPSCNSPGLIRCNLANVCVKSIADCKTIADRLVAAGSIPATCPNVRCYDGSCADQVAFCSALDAPAAGYIRCADGSVSAAGACTGVTTPSCGLTGTTATTCPSGGCPLGGAPTLDACPAYNGCGVGQVRASDCVCRAPGYVFANAPAGLPFMCADGTFKNDPSRCMCNRYTPLPMQVVGLGSGTGTRRRFAVRANVAINFNVAGAGSVGNLVNFDIPANLAADNGCFLGVMQAPDSVVDSFASSTANLVTPAVIVSFLSSNVTLANGNAAPCTLTNGVVFSVQFAPAAVESISPNATLNCAFPFTDKNAGSNATNGTVAAVAPSTIPKCTLTGTRIVGIAVALANSASIAAKATVAPVVSTPTPTATPATPTPSGSGASATPTGPAASATPTNGTGTVSASKPASFSALLVALVAVLLAAAF